ncbi:hypothetical protein [Sphingomonas sp.]|uniref:hypothetical protein n=1 Tax=Sphingomonas sp. TaxID=28214 RepID=UPI003B3A9269
MVIAIFTLLLLATPFGSADVEICPGGPAFGFVSGSDRFDARTEEALDGYLENLDRPLWRPGWITVFPTVAGPADGPAHALAERRKITIAKRLSNRGLKTDRVRFEGLRSASPDEVDTNVYYSTLSTPRTTWKALVTPGIMC